MPIYNTTQIYTFRSCEFSISGTRYDVSTVSMEMSTNGIPSCTIGIAPKDGGDGQVPVNALYVDSLQETYKQLTQQAEQLVEVDFKIELWVNGPMQLPVDTSIQLKKWILVGVGLTRLSTTQGFSILCTISHPAYKLTLRNGFFFTSKGTVNFDTKCKEVIDPVDAAKRTIEAVQAANEEEGGLRIPFSDGVETSAGFKNEQQVVDDIKESIKGLKEDLENTLKWDKETFANAKNNIPCENIVTKIGDAGVNAMKYAMMEMWSFAMVQSAWDALVSNICPVFGLEVIPKYDEEKLIVSPWMPWTEPKIELQDYMIETMLLPGKDPDPIYGFLLYEGESENPSNPCITMANGAQENSYIAYANMAFVPNSSKASVGSLKYCGRPGWIDTAIHKACSFGALPPITMKGQDYEDDQEKQDPGGAGDNKELAVWNAVIYSNMNNLFLAEYKKGVVADLSCAFLPNWNGTLVHPGIRMSVKTGEKTLFTGRITTVRHMIDCATSRASTAISLAYCLNGDESSVLGTTPESPFYGATGKLSS